MLRHYFTADSTPLHYKWVAWDRISPHLGIAAVAAEDQKFPYHWGFDLDSIQNAIKEKIKTKKTRGASTITQQVAKNLFLWPGKNFMRKGLESYFTVLIELIWPKQRILEVYLNIVEFGPGVYGAQAASNIYFGKSAATLRPDEAALLIAVLPNPKKLKVARPGPYVRKRANEIEQQMRMLGGNSYLQAYF